MPIRDVALKTTLEERTIQAAGERGSGRSMLVARDDNDKEYLVLNNKQVWYAIKPNQPIKKHPWKILVNKMALIGSQVCIPCDVFSHVDGVFLQNF